MTETDPTCEGFQLFFGYNIQPFRSADEDASTGPTPSAFSGLSSTGNTLSGRTRSVPDEINAQSSDQTVAPPAPPPTPFSGTGNSLTQPSSKPTNVIVIDD